MKVVRLMLPLARKSVEPMAARVDALHASARHQSLHHFVAKAEWSLTPLDQVDSEPIRAEIYKRATGRDLSQVTAGWSRLVFSGKAQPPKELARFGRCQEIGCIKPEGDRLHREERGR